MALAADWLSANPVETGAEGSNSGSLALGAALPTGDLGVSSCFQGLRGRRSDRSQAINALIDDGDLIFREGRLFVADSEPGTTTT